MAIANEGVLDLAKVLQPKAEAEVSLALAADLNKVGATVNDVIAATGHALLLSKIVVSRSTGWKIIFADSVADSGSSAFYVLGYGGKPPTAWTSPLAGWRGR